jgi:dihydroorotate dehydrogenase electron transfer subunit
MIKDRELVLQSLEEILPDVYRLAFPVPPDFSHQAFAGMFVQLEASSGTFPILRRPFTISSLREGIMEIVFEDRGRGTRILAALEPGTGVRVLGPLGQGYRLTEGSWLLIGGGMGAAGFPFLMDSVSCSRMILGARSEERLLVPEGADADCTTEDGSFGRRGLVTALLEEVSWNDFQAVALCGPAAMMKAVVEMMPEGARRITQVSTEARMGCGWGACEGCSIPATGGGYLKCCTDGPVIFACDIDWGSWEGV